MASGRQGGQAAVQQVDVALVDPQDRIHQVEVDQVDVAGVGDREAPRGVVAQLGLDRLDAVTGPAPSSWPR